MNINKRFLTKNLCYIRNTQRADARYIRFQDSPPSGLMLHSVGCAQPSAQVFCDLWDKADESLPCVHAFVDANTGDVVQTLPWQFRAWHCGGSGNNTHIGVEMCESGAVRYRADKPWLFDVLDKSKAQADCKRAYDSAVSLFAELCETYKLNPLTQIISHKEGTAKGIASNHGDPEHYWAGLGMSYTMDGFRRDVKKKMEGNAMPTSEELEELITKMLDREFKRRFDAAYSEKMKALSDNDAGKWSQDARQWAVESGIVKGVGTGKDGSQNYAWEQPLTKEQYVTMEYRQLMGGTCSCGGK